MVDFEFLYRGLCGMANAHRANSMTGHLGAAVVAGYFLGEDHPVVDPGVFTAVERDLNRITGGEESIWFDPKKAGITSKELFQPFPKEQGQEEFVDNIARALEGNIGETRQSGHNVIFASIAIRAFRGHQDFASAKLVSGIERLIVSFDGQHPGRGYYGKERGWITGNEAPLADAQATPDYGSLDEMVAVVVEELIATAGEHRRGFGGLFHLINHAAALTELDRQGFAELARKGLPAHRHHLRLYRALPNLEDELGKLETTSKDPFKPDYWKRTESIQWGAWLTHRIKTLYGFHTLLPMIDDAAKRKKALSRFGYLLA